ncbi:CDGSH iron-sulfur domain-containing protein [Inquilinus limosus]|uniref:CDGSH iron-sulfur domain-containing protein n=1 Tax=Inquilinus limosus TaxID=171674 RepID=UPI00040AE66B|nr:CDGSH iron-sulfur domain-containing protein [Inquilinus limosus]
MTAEPVCAGDAPIPVDLAEGQAVRWCACGRSAAQPFCDGSHQGCGIGPVAFVAARAKTYFFCTCKRSGRQPLCDGRHNFMAPPQRERG